MWPPEVWEAGQSNEEAADMGEEGRGSMRLGLGSLIKPILPGTAEGELAGLPVPV